MSGFVKAVFGNGESTTNVQTAAPSAEERELIKLNTQLAQKQLANLDQLAPFQQKLLELSMSDLDTQLATSKAFNAAVTPEQQAELAKQDYERALRLGPIQEELLQRELETIRSGGAATPEQMQRIKEATDAAIESGSSDIDLSTKRGIGLIADELANSRGLRLSDSPIMNEAGQLVAGGEDLKASLIKNLRAGEASARLNFPLAAAQITSGITTSQQGIAEASKQFQAELRQRAFQNRLALSGQTSSSGIGMASVGSGVGSSTLSSLSGVRSQNRTSTGFDPASVINSYGQLGRGIGMAAAGMG